MSYSIEYSIKLLKQGSSITMILNDANPEDTFQQIVLGFLLTGTCLFGILGSIISGLVLARSEMKSSANFVLLGLAFWNTVFLAVQSIQLGFYNLFKFYEIFPNYRWHCHPILTPYYAWASISSQTGSIYFTLAIAIERIIVIYFPTLLTKLFRMKWARQITPVISILCLLFGLPYFFALDASPVELSMDKTTVLPEELQNATFSIYQPSYTHYGRNSLLFQNYAKWGQAIYQFFLPFLATVILNAFIIVKVRAQRRNRHALLTAAQRAELAISRMILCVITVFLICYFPWLVDSILQLIISFRNLDPVDYNELFFTRSKFASILELLATINSASSFIIYCLMGNRFRASLFQMVIDFRNCATCANRPRKSKTRSQSKASNLSAVSNSHL